MRILLIGLSVMCLFSLSACDTSSNDQVAAINIGLAAPLTGTSTRVGQEMRMAAEMAIVLANEDLADGRAPFRLTVEDTNSDTDGTEDAFNKLISTGIAFIVGPYTSTNTEKIIPLIDEARIVTVAPTSAAQGLAAKSDWLFRTSLTVDLLMPVGVRATHEFLDYKNVGVLTNAGDRFSQSAEDKFIEEIDRLSGVSIGMEQSYNRSGGDPVPDLTSHINALTTASPKLDVLFFFGLATDRYNFILKAHELGVRDLPFVITFLGTSDIRLARSSAPTSTEGIITLHTWISGSNHSASKAYVRDHQERYNEIPTDIHARTHAAFDLLMRAILEVPPDNISSDAVKEQLAGTEDIDTIYGSFSFDSNGDAEFSPVVGIVRGPDIELLEQ